MRKSPEMGTIPTRGTEPNSSAAHVALSTPSRSPTRPTTESQGQGWEPGSHLIPARVPPGRIWASAPSHCSGPAASGLDECRSPRMSCAARLCSYLRLRGAASAQGSGRAPALKMLQELAGTSEAQPKLWSWAPKPGFPSHPRPASHTPSDLAHAFREMLQNQPGFSGAEGAPMEG